MTTLPSSSSELSVQEFQCYYNTPLLSEIEEQELTEQYYQDQDITAAHQLVMAHMRYVVKIARNYLGYGLPLSELVQEGSVGLMKAVKKFDPKVGVRLVSFAVHWIKAEIHEFVIKNWSIVKIATTKTQRKLFFNLRRLQQQLIDQPQHIQNKKIAEELDVPLSDVESMSMRMRSVDVELDKPVLSESSQQTTLQETLSCPESKIETLVMEHRSQQQMNQFLLKAFENLNDREKSVLSARYYDQNKRTLKELALEMDISLERVRQIEKAALNKLKKLLNQDNITQLEI